MGQPDRGHLPAKAGVGRSPATIATRRAHLARLAHGVRNSCVSFFAWAHRAGHLAANPAAEFPVAAASQPVATGRRHHTRPGLRLWRPLSLASC